MNRRASAGTTGRRGVSPRRKGRAGLTLVELMVSVTILLVVMGGLAKLLIQSSQVNRKEQMAAQTQANARHCVSMITQVLRSAGWDPAETGFTAIDLDATPLDGEQSIRVYTDLNADSDSDDADEDVTIRRVGTRVEWRKTSDTDSPFVVLADNITNDADGDGTVEAMFVPDSLTSPREITIRITAASPIPDSRTGQSFRYTVSSEVAIRKNLQ